MEEEEKAINRYLGIPPLKENKNYLFGLFKFIILPINGSLARCNSVLCTLHKVYVILLSTIISSIVNHGAQEPRDTPSRFCPVRRYST